MGRRPVPLNVKGQAQARRLARYLSFGKIHKVYSSPALRTFQTASIVARSQKTRVLESEALLELDYGKWVGHFFSDVQNSQSFQCYHRNPQEAQVPGGESVLEAQKRIMRFVMQLKRRYARGGRRQRIMLVSHADMIKLAVVGALGMSLEDYQKFRIDHCTVTFLWFYEKYVRLITLNSHTRGNGLFKGKVPAYLVRYMKKNERS